jgi:hypothetical protein
MRDPGWFENLPPETQTDLVAEYLIENETPKQREERKAEYNRSIARRFKHG